MSALLCLFQTVRDHFVCRQTVPYFTPGAVGCNVCKFGAHGAGAECAYSDAALFYFRGKRDCKAEHVCFCGAVDCEVAERQVRCKTCRIDDCRTAFHVRENKSAYSGKRRAVKVDHVELAVNIGVGERAVGAEPCIINKHCHSEGALGFFSIEQRGESGYAFASSYIHFNGAGERALYIGFDSLAAEIFKFRTKQIESVDSARNEP